MDLNFTELKPHICISCENKYIHRKTYYDLGNGLQEMKISYECGKCSLIRRRLKTLDKKIQQLKDDKLNNQFTLFCRMLQNRE
jgi:hypothetical protein